MNDENQPTGSLSIEHNVDGSHPGSVAQTPVTITPSHEFVTMALVMLLLLAIFCLSLFQYDKSHNVGTKAYNALNTHLQTTVAANSKLTNQNKSLTTHNATLTAQNTELQNEKTQFCTELGKAKVNDPLCTK